MVVDEQYVRISESDKMLVDQMAINNNQELRIIKRVARSYPRYSNIISRPIAVLYNRMLELGFQIKNKTFEGYDVETNELNFEKENAETAWYVQIALDKNMPLRFSVVFGVKRKNREFDWIRAGSLSRKKAEGWSARNWGKRNFISLNPQSDFLKDWNILLDNLNAIYNFLDRGIEDRYVIAASIGK